MGAERGEIGGDGSGMIGDGGASRRGRAREGGGGGGGRCTDEESGGDLRHDENRHSSGCTGAGASAVHGQG